MGDEDVTVTISTLFGTINEHLRSQDGLLHHLVARLDTVATKEDVQRVERRLDGHDEAIAALTTKQAEDEAAEDQKEKTRKAVAWAVGGVAVPLLAALIIVLATVVH